MWPSQLSLCARMKIIIPCPVVQYFSTLSRKRRDFRTKKKLLINIWKKHFSLREEFSKIRSETYISLHVKYQLLLSDCAETLIFSTDFRKILKTLVFMKIRPVGGELFHADGWTDRYGEANSRFSQFSERLMRHQQNAQYYIYI